MKGHFRPLGSETPELIQVTIGIFDYVHRPRPHAKYGVRRKRGWGGHKYACFLIFFDFLNAPTTHPEKREFSLNAPKNVFWRASL